MIKKTTSFEGYLNTEDTQENIIINMILAMTPSHKAWYPAKPELILEFTMYCFSTAQMDNFQLH